MDTQNKRRNVKGHQIVCCCVFLLLFVKEIKPSGMNVDRKLNGNKLKIAKKFGFTSDTQMKVPRQRAARVRREFKLILYGIQYT